MRFVKPLLIAAGIATFVAPVTARADDATFFEQLNQDGIQFPDPAAAIAAAREVCDYIASGHTAAQAARGVKNANPELPLTHAAHFVALAREAYCNQPVASTGGSQTVGGSTQP